VKDLSGPMESSMSGHRSPAAAGQRDCLGLTCPRPSPLWLETLYKNQLQRPDLLLSVGASTPPALACWSQGGAPWSYTLTTSEASTTQASGVDQWPPNAGGCDPEGGWESHRWPNCSGWWCSGVCPVADSAQAHPCGPAGAVRDG